MSTFLIERIDGPRKTWLSEKIGRDFAAGKYGGWADERSKATEYTQEDAEAILSGALMHIAPYCTVVEK